jgi:hypothetical protein
MGLLIELRGFTAEWSMRYPLLLPGWSMRFAPDWIVKSADF